LPEIGDEDDARELRIHFEGPLTRDHTLPAPALVQALQQLQRVVFLLAMAEGGQIVRQRARVTQDIERRFPLVCHLPKAGGYVLPVEIGDAGHQLFDQSAIQRVAQKTRNVIDAVNRADIRKLNDLVPDTYYRSTILTAFDSMQPPVRSGLVLHLEDANEIKLLDGHTARQRIAQLVVRPTSDAAATPGYIVGALIEMKFQERRLKLQLLGTGKALDATYSDDFEPVLLKHPRELIQVHANIVYGEQMQPESISDVDEILDVDDSPIEVAAISVDNYTLKAMQPLSFTVRFDRDAQLYEAEGPFGVILGAVTRPQLEAQVDAELAILWREYALAATETLSPGARDLREQLLSTFRDENDAP
jgi:hypothetical protein